MDFNDIFARYEGFVAEVDAIFNKVKEAHPEAVKCAGGCDDCCYALFDLSLVEAMYLNQKFNELFSGAARSDVMQRADKADREAYKIKRKVFKASQEGRKAAEILEEVAAMRVRCPLLDEDSRCDLYDYRPVTCRLYGIPTAYGGESRTCGLSDFKPGDSYPTVNMEQVHERLYNLSRELVASINTKHVGLEEILVPVSMALMNKYDDDYLGIVEGAESQESDCGSCGGGHTWEVKGPEKERHAAPGGIGDLRPPSGDEE